VIKPPAAIAIVLTSTVRRPVEITTSTGRRGRVCASPTPGARGLPPAQHAVGLRPARWKARPPGRSQGRKLLYRCQGFRVVSSSGVDGHGLQRLLQPRCARLRRFRVDPPPAVDEPARTTRKPGVRPGRGRGRGRRSGAGTAATPAGHHRCDLESELKSRTWGGMITRSSAKLIFASLSRSLIRLRPGASVDIGYRYDGAG
jgi:hypothetical protein